MATAERQRLTVEEYLVVGEADPRPTELIDGEIVVVTGNRFGHARLQALLIGSITAWEQRYPGRAQVAGPTTVRLPPYDVYSPDLVVVGSQARRDERGRLEQVPLICVEIRSPSTWRYDVGRKKSVYEAHGVPELWLVDGEASVVLVFRRSSARAQGFDVALERSVADRLGSPLLPGFSLALGGLFGG